MRKVLNNFKMIFISFIISFSFQSHAYLVQILHTNDIHSYFDGTDHDKTRGGYANVKSMIDKYKLNAQNKGIESLVVDAGDFMEGTLFYMADFGKKSFQMHNQMGYDFSVVGNHDFLMGTKDLNSLLGDVDLKFTYLSANVSANKKYQHINEKIVPYKIVNLGGYKVALMGLTTDEIVFSWRLYEGKIDGPIKYGKKLSKKLKKKLGVDAVIALTHIGFNSDKKLAKRAPDIDLIIGGHSHDALRKAYYQKSRRNKKIPIVQAGHHGEYLGRLLLDITKKGIQIVEYQLLPVIANSNANQEILDLVEKSYSDLYGLYGQDYLHQQISHSYLSADSDEAKSIWSLFTADAMKESLDADISVQQENMSGPNYPVGAITNFDLMNAHPRFFDFTDLFGWKVYKAKVNGFMLKTLFKVVMNFGLPLSISGITFDWYETPWGKYRVKNLKIKGKHIHPFRSYDLALPEGIVRGGLAISPLVGLLLRKSERTNIDVIDAIRWKLERDGGIGNDYLQRLDYKQAGQQLVKADRLLFAGRTR
jgi:5'-nucleotidase / UDP-sugar diphosphatase